MEKPLHERLRVTESFVSSWCLNMEKVTPDIIDTGRCDSKVCGECFAEWAKALADEIERDYVTKELHEAEVEDARQKACRQVMTSWALDHSMPMKDGECITEWLDRWLIKLPTLDDGTPILHGRWYEGKSDGKHWLVVGFGEGKYDVFGRDDDGTIKPLKSKWLRKISPKVLDADGVPCKSNDEVWGIHKDKHIYEDGDMMIVVGVDAGVKDRQVLVRRALGGAGEHWVNADQLTHERPVFDADGERIRNGDTVWDNKGYKGTVIDINEGVPQVIVVERGMNDMSCLPPNFFTHREPDSIAKVRDDLQAAYDERADGEIPGIIERLTALDERGA